MARNDRFPQVYSVGFDGHYESEESGSSGQIDTGFAASSEYSTAPRQKCIDLNSASRYGFEVPFQVVSLSRLSSAEKGNLVLRLRSDLAKIRALLKKLEWNKSRPITLPSSGDILSCNNVQKSAHTQNSKRPLDTTSAPAKKANSSAQESWDRGTLGRFKSAKSGPVSNPNAAMLKQCESLLKKLLSHQCAWVFEKPVDVVALNIPDYFTVIKKPMDLGTIKSKLASGLYAGPLDFAADVRLTFSNAMTYNPQGNNVHVWADTMSKFFEARWKVVEKNMARHNSQSIPDRSRIHEALEGTEIVKPSTSKKRKLSPPQHSAISETTVLQRKVDEPRKLEPVKLRMTDDDKRKLMRELEPLLEELPDNINNFFRELSSSGAQVGEDEIEIDFDNLKDDALFTLRKLLDEHLHEKRKNDAKAEACEIELPHESGLSSSSMRIEKGNDILDEDADIGDSEPPVSSNPPVENLRVAGSCGPSGGGTEVELSMSIKQMKPNSSSQLGRMGAQDLEGTQSGSELEQLEQSVLEKPISDVADDHQGGECATEAERQASLRAAILKNRFADTIFKAREKTLGQGNKVDPENLRREMEELEIQKKKERARLQAEAKAAEDAQRRAEAEAAAEAKRRRELEREAARQALLKIEKTVEINENSQFLEDLEMLRTGLPEQLPSSDDEASPDNLQGDFGSFKFGASNPLEQLGLYIKPDDDEEEVEPFSLAEDEDGPVLPERVKVDVEEGEID